MASMQVAIYLNQGGRFALKPWRSIMYIGVRAVETLRDVSTVCVVWVKGHQRNKKFLYAFRMQTEHTKYELYENFPLYGSFCWL